MLIKCPQCGHSVLSVASLCPRCSYLFTARRFQQGQQGTLTECHRCGGKVVSEARTCPYCGLGHPGHRRVQRTSLVLSAIAVLAVVGVGVRSLIMNRPMSVTTTTDDVRPTLSPLPVPRGPSVAPTEAPPLTVTLMETRWTSTWVNVREEPAVAASVLQILRPGQRVEVAELEGRWWLTYRDGQRIGYIANLVLQMAPPEP